MSEMTIIPDLYLGGIVNDGKTGKHYISILKLVRIAAKSMVKYTISVKNVINRSMSVADVLLYQCEQKRLELQPIEVLMVLTRGCYIVIDCRIITLLKKKL